MPELDIRSEDSVLRCIDEIRTRADRVDVLVNNAGVMHEGFAEETTSEQAVAVFDTTSSVPCALSMPCRPS